MNMDNPKGEALFFFISNSSLYKNQINVLSCLYSSTAAVSSGKSYKTCVKDHLKSEVF